MGLLQWWRGRAKGDRFRHLRSGQYYRVAQPFADHDGRIHAAGQRWRFERHDFLPYEDGLSLFVTDERGQDLQIRLQWRAEAEGAIIDALDRYLVPCPPPHRAAFASLVAVTDDGLTVFDGVARRHVRWHDLHRITAAYGKQQYDMTRVLMIDHAGGRSIFLPESEPCWAPFLAGVARHLQGALTVAEWDRRLPAGSAHDVTVWHRRLVGA